MTSMRAIALNGFGKSSVLKVATAVPRPVLTSPEDVIIRVAAAGVNRGDIMQRKGHYPPPPGASDILGLEAAGVVVEAGSAARETMGWKPGDRVAALLSGGGMAQYARAHGGSLMRVPPSMSMIQAAGFAEAFCTAYQAVVWHGSKSLDRCWSGTTPPLSSPRTGVLVHAGASGVGLACIQVAKQLGTKRVAATCSADKIPQCIAAGADVAVDRATAGGWATAVRDGLARLGGGGDKEEGAVDLIVDPVFGKDYFHQNVQLLRKDGGIVVLSFLNGTVLDPPFDPRPMFAKRNWIKFSTLRSQSDAYKAQLVADVERDVLPLVVNGKINLHISRVATGLEELALVHDDLEANRIVGKAVIVVDKDVV